jgi:probable rRNA maturation factor
MGRISITNQQETVPIDFKLMRETARVVLEGEGEPEAEVNVAFVDDSTIHVLNKRYLNHDEPTDVLSFPLSEGKKLSGQIVIGAEVALREATERGHDVQVELALYVIHGLLHLCGHDDHEDADRDRMRECERQYLALLGLPDVSPREEE